MADEGRVVVESWCGTNDCGECDVCKLVEKYKRSLFLAEHLFQMIPKEVWREQGAEWMGQYEGDHWAEQTLAELQEMRSELDV